MNPSLPPKRLELLEKRFSQPLHIGSPKEVSSTTGFPAAVDAASAQRMKNEGIIHIDDSTPMDLVLAPASNSSSSSTSSSSSPGGREGRSSSASGVQHSMSSSATLLDIEQEPSTNVQPVLKKSVAGTGFAPQSSSELLGEAAVINLADSDSDLSRKRPGKSQDSSIDGLSNDEHKPLSKVLRSEDSGSRTGGASALHDSSSRGGKSQSIQITAFFPRKDSSTVAGAASHAADGHAINGSPQPVHAVSQQAQSHSTATVTNTASHETNGSPKGNNNNNLQTPQQILSPPIQQAQAPTPTNNESVNGDVISTSITSIHASSNISTNTSSNISHNNSNNNGKKDTGKTKGGPSTTNLLNWGPATKVRTGSGSNGPAAVSSAFNAVNAAEKSSVPDPSTAAALNAQIATLTTTVQQLQSVNADLRRQVEAQKQSKEQAEHRGARLDSEVKLAQEKYKLLEEQNSRLSKHLEQITRESALQEFRRKRDKLALDFVRLGRIATVKQTNMASYEVWEDGYALKDIQKRQGEQLANKEELEKRKRKNTAARRQHTAQARRGAAQGAGDVQILAEDAPVVEGELDIDILAENEAIKAHTEQLKRDEQNLHEEKRLLESQKAVHMKEIKRCQGEEKSRFYRDLPCLNQRYVPTCMIGKGGFSEVWKALDLVELKDVAIKIHQLNTGWNEERRAAYIKHVTREYTIHREMKHPRVVQLFDVFEIDDNSFATVLEYCKGIDLDEKLKRMKTIPEKDARTILLQIVSGLKYLNTPSDGSHAEDESGNMIANPGTRRTAIIHYDLKPANILFDEMGDAKITDFGLSKILDDSAEDGTSMELTSQGAGTYYYLPPECFSRPQDGPPRISSKVDVWSLGVIYYQMIYGKKPFGEGKCQERILAEGIMLNANQVEFPNEGTNRNRITEEAKDFIRACLTPDPRFRPDVFALCQSPYIRNMR